MKYITIYLNCLYISDNFLTKRMLTSRSSHWVNSFMQSLLQKVSFYLCLRPMNNEDKMIPPAAVTA